MCQHSTRLLPAFQQQLLHGTQDPPCPPLSPTTTAPQSITLHFGGCSLPALFPLRQDGRWLEAAESASVCCVGQTACSQIAPQSSSARPPSLASTALCRGYHLLPSRSAMESVSQDIFPCALLLAFPRSVGELSDSFSQSSGHLVQRCVPPTASHSIVLCSPTLGLPEAAQELGTRLGQERGCSPGQFSFCETHCRP